MDLALRHNGTFFDLALGPVDLETDDGLRTASIVSMFTDRRAEETDVLPDGTDDRRGWWGDVFMPGELRLGSRLWLLSRAKTTKQALIDAVAYAEEAHQWMVDDGIAKSVAATAERLGDETLAITVTIQRPDGTDIDYRYELNWKAT